MTLAWDASKGLALLDRLSLISPSFDFGDAGVAVERIGDVDTNAIGGIGGEVDGPFDQVVAADRAPDEPGSAVPALHGEVSQSPCGECHGVGRFDRIRRVILHRIDHDVIDELAASEVDLDPIRESTGGGVVPTTSIAPIDTGAFIVVDGANREGSAIGARCAGHAAIAGQGNVDLARWIDKLR